MGIKFLCEHCKKKIHVKDFLAGKRAKCPHCEAGIRIPAASTITGDIAQTEQPDSVEEEVVSKANTDAESAVATKTKGSPNRSTHSKRVAATSQDASVDTKTTFPEATAPVQSKPENPAPKAEAIADTPPHPTPASTPVADPFADAGNAMWYVAPPSGGQYGPADSKMLQAWIDEGRVSADSLVWREGWADWRSASVVMNVPAAPAVPPPNAVPPETATGNGAVPAASTASPSSDAAVNKETSKADKSSVVRYHRAHQRSRGLGIMLIATLAIVSVALVVVLIIVLKLNS